MNYRARRIFRAATFLGVILAATSAWAVDRTYTGSGSWNTAANWGGTIPGPSDKAIILAGSTVTIDAAPPTSINYLKVNVGGLLIIRDTFSLTLNSLDLVNGTPIISGGGVVMTPVGATLAGFGSGRIQILHKNNLTLCDVDMTVGNMFLNYADGNPNISNPSSSMEIAGGTTFTINGHLDMPRGAIQFGTSAKPTAPITTLVVLGNITIGFSGAGGDTSFLYYKGKQCTVKVAGDWTQYGGKVKGSGSTTTSIFNGSKNPQTVYVQNNTLDFSDYDILSIEGSARTVNFEENLLIPGGGFRVLMDMTVMQNITVVIKESVDATANVGIGTAANTFRIDSGAKVTFTKNYNCSSKLTFADPSGGANQDGVLRLEGSITNDATQLGAAFTPGKSTVEYAGQSVAQTVYTRIGGATPISYWNLVIDNTGAVATQEGATLTVLNTLKVGKSTNTNAQFTAVAQTINVGKDFICNAFFTHGNSTFQMVGTGSIMQETTPVPNLTFYILSVAGAAGGTDVVTAARSFAVNNSFTVPRGTLTSTGTLPLVTMTANLGLTIGVASGATGPAVLNLVGPVTVEIGSTPTRLFLVNQLNGRFVAAANAAGTPKMTRPNDTGGAGNYTATVNGQANLYGFKFSYGDALGLNLTATSTIERIRNVRFSGHAGGGGHFLTITQPGIDLDCPGCWFDTISSGTNVWAVDSANDGNPVRLRFEFRTSGSGATDIGGPGGGEAFDGDDDANDNGVIDAGDSSTHGGAIVQWPYTANVDMSGVIQGFPEPALDWTTGLYYSTYVIMRQGGGPDSIYVLTIDGDLQGAPFVPTAGAGNIVGPLYWDTEPNPDLLVGGVLHVLYFGTSTGRVYKLVDSGGGTLTAAANWSPYVTNSQLDSVTSSVISDQNYIYFGGYDVQGAGNAYGFYRIPCVNPSPFPAPTLTLTPVSSSPSWVDTINGRMVWTAGSNRIYRVSTVSWGVDASYAPGTTFTAPTSIPIDTIYEGGQNGVMYGLVPYGDPNTVTPATGFPFNPSSGSAISGGAGWDSLKSRLIFGNDLGQIYTLNVTLGGAWNLGTTYWRSTTTGGAIQTTPLVQDGVMYVSNTTGKVYVFDFYNGYVGPPYGENLNQTLLVTWNFGSGALGDLSREAVLTGRLYVGTTGGKLYAFWPTPDPTVAK